MTVSFDSRLMRPEVRGGWTFALVPPDAVTRAGFRPRMRVSGSIDKVPFRSSLIPRGGGQLFVVVNNELRDKIGKTAGQTVALVLDVDRTKVVLKVPPALAGALAVDQQAKANFERFTVSQKRAYVTWIGDAKQEETRNRRVSLAVKKLRAGEKLT